MPSAACPQPRLRCLHRVAAAAEVITPELWSNLQSIKEKGAASLFRCPPLPPAWRESCPRGCDPEEAAGVWGLNREKEVGVEGF